MTAFRTDGHTTAQQERMVRKQLSPDFLDPAHEWRRLFAEAWGTFLLVVVAAGGGVVAARSGGAVTLGMIAVAPGLMVMAIIYFMGTVSGAHLNPAVTLAFAARGNFPWGRVPGYVLAQMIGASAAALFLRVMFGTVGALGATVPGHGVSSTAALAMEVVLTAGLVNTILGTASGARSLAPDLVRGDLGTAWIYVAGPVLGALIDVAFEWILKGKPTTAGTVAAEGALGVDDPTRAAD